MGFLHNAGRGRFSWARGERLSLKDVTAPRTLEGRRLFRENPLIYPVAGVATSTLDLDHFPTSQPQQKNSTGKSPPHDASARPANTLSECE